MAPHDASSANDAQAVPKTPGTPGGKTENVEPGGVDTRHGSASGVLTAMAAAAEGPRISIGALVDGLQGRAFGILLLLFAIPALIPFLVGVHSAVGVPLAMLAWQMALGRKEPWLPDTIRKQEIDVAAFRKMTEAAVPWIRRAEALTRPRLDFLTNGVFERVLAVFVIFFAGVIFLPGPGTNGVPGFCVALIALGLVERDGVVASAGVVIGVSYVVLAAGVIWIAVVKLWEMAGGALGAVF